MPADKASYLTLWDPWNFSYHLSEIGKYLVDSLILLERKEVTAGEILQELVRIESHLEGLPILRKGIGTIRSNYETIRDYIEQRYKNHQTSLNRIDQRKLRIELTGLLEGVFSLIATGLNSLSQASAVIRAGKFPGDLKLKVRIGKQEEYIDRAFTIGRLDNDHIGVRSIPHEMSFEELARKAGSTSEISKFPVIFECEEKIERREYEIIASRIHVAVFHDGYCFRIFDVSESETIIEIDGYARRLVGYRVKRCDLLLLLPLGRYNRLWIDPIKGAAGIPIEITVPEVAYYRTKESSFLK